MQAAFLRGLFGADGCVSRVEAGGKANRYVGLGSRSDGPAEGCPATAVDVGDPRAYLPHHRERSDRASRYTRKDGTTVEYASREGFDLRVTGTDLARFAAEIGFSCPRKQAAVESLVSERSLYRTKAGTTLLAREDDGQEMVYNLTEPLHHSYIVDGVVVANCSEYMHVDDSACNLASLNLMKFRRADGTLDVQSFEHAVDIMLLAQEIVVGPSSYPTEEIGVNARAFRQLGLGYANLGAYLMSNGMPYDSDAGRGTAAAITALMTGRAYRASAEDRRGARALRALRGEPRGAQRRDADAPRRLLRDRRGLPAATRSCSPPRGAHGTRRSSSASTTATATRRPRCSRLRARSHS